MLEAIFYTYTSMRNETLEAILLIPTQDSEKCINFPAPV